MTARTVELLQPPVTQRASYVKVPYKSSAMLQMEKNKRTKKKLQSFNRRLQLIFCSVAFGG